MPYLPRHKIKNCKAKILAYFMTEIRPPKTLNHIFPEKVFYAFSLKNHRSICRKSGAGPALARLRILCTQKIQGPSSSCLVCVYYVRKRFGAWAQAASSAYTMYAKNRIRALGCLVCVYYVRKRSRARAHSALIAYTVYAKDPGPELILLR